EDFRSADTYKDVRQTLLGVTDRMQAMGVIKLEAEPVMLNEKLKDICEEFAKRHKFFATHTIEGDLKGNFGVQAQRELLETAVRVLFSNAARAVITRAASGDPDYTPMVKCVLRRDPHRVVLSVIDNGG